MEKAITTGGMQSVLSCRLGMLAACRPLNLLKSVPWQAWVHNINGKPDAHQIPVKILIATVDTGLHALINSTQPKFRLNTNPIEMAISILGTNVWSYFRSLSIREIFTFVVLLIVLYVSKIYIFSLVYLSSHLIKRTVSSKYLRKRLI
jgi:hypothetical protein